MITEDIKLLVWKEATLLRHLASKEEKEALSLEKLNVPTFCGGIYKIMTGTTTYLNERALMLSFMCGHEYTLSLTTYEPIKGVSSRYDGLRYYTTLEFYTAQKGAKNETLIDYIKGEITEIELSDL